ncbi:hypothetical protein [Runella sp.]|jgi:hypothetical protein|uniref:hypothetical protein n=1 Tax=Runella sp. TaxID=1960881 RepID=UPI00260AFFDC|nr:hypothetical protein [Runella sp.]
MKKLLSIAVSMLVFVTAINAQTEKAAIKKDIARIEKKEAELSVEKHEAKMELRELAGKEVSEQSKKQLMSDFGISQNAQWERTDHFDEATFMKDGKIQTAFYDYDTKLVGTTTIKTFSDLPAIGQKYINEYYKSYTVGDIIEYDDNGPVNSNMIFFNKRFEDADHYFVELKKENKKIVVQVSMDGTVSYFTRLI